MSRIRFDFGSLTLDAELLDTPTAKAVAAALPIRSSVLTWGEEVYFGIGIAIARESDARAVVTPGEIAYWPDGRCIAIGFGRTPISGENETRLAKPVQRLRQSARQREGAERRASRRAGVGHLAWKLIRRLRKTVRRSVRGPAVSVSRCACPRERA